jgi:hypothetical protein
MSSLPHKRGEMIDMKNLFKHKELFSEISGNEDVLRILRLVRSSCQE